MINTTTMTTREALNAYADAIPTMTDATELRMLKAMIETTARGAKMAHDTRTLTICTELKRDVTARIKAIA